MDQTEGNFKVLAEEEFNKLQRAREQDIYKLQEEHKSLPEAEAAVGPIKYLGMPVVCVDEPINVKGVWFAVEKIKANSGRLWLRMLNRDECIQRGLPVGK